VTDIEISKRYVRIKLKNNEISIAVLLSSKQIDRHRDQLKLPGILGSAKKSMSHIILTYPCEITRGV
jgi:hypothetical protein